jgi:V8-like Glu-specific endopeptidase
MTTQIRPNRLEVSDRFPMLGFTVRTDGSAKRYEIAIGTSPDLFGPDGRSHRSRSNFYSTRAAGLLPIDRGEAVYVLPAEVLARFVGQEKLYYGLATTSNGAGGVEVNTMPGSASPYINISRLTGRSLQRVRLLPNRQRAASNYGKTGSEMDWAGDAMTPGTEPVTPPAAKNGAAKDGSSAAAPVHYDDGYGPLPASPAPAVPKAQPQTKSLADDVARPDDDAQHGIEGPIPDEGSAAQALARPLAIAAEYPQASRFEPAAGVNFRAVTGTRTINRIVIHITDGGPKINGTIGWFQNPNQRNAKGDPIHVSAHYVIGQDGEVVQMVKHNDVAWHASSANSDSIGIEHVARAPHAWDKLLGHADAGLMPTDVQCCASAALVNWLCNEFNIPLDRTHILGHSEASPRDHHDGCPNAVWNWDYYMGMVTSGSCQDSTTASASSLATEGAARKPQHSSMPRATALRQVDAGYAPSNPQEALRYMQEFQNRKQAWGAGVPDTTFFPHSAVCALRMTIDGSPAGGTGFYIADDRILTCGHNLAGASSVTIIPGKNGDTEPFGSFTASPADWIIHPKFDVTVARSSPTGHDFDLAVIKVSTPPPNGEAFRILEELLQCQGNPIIVCGYAAATVDKNKQHLDGDDIRLLNDSGEVFMYNLQTEGGTSGSPVYYVVARDDEARQQSVLETHLIGVHVDFVPGSNILNEGCRLTADKIAWINSVGNPFSAGASALSTTAKKHDRAASSSIAAPVRAQAVQPASTTSGFGVADDARRTLKCIQREAEQNRPISFVLRYLMREMSLAETTALSNAGLQLVSCYEANPADPPITIYTRSKGQQDAKRAFAKAQQVGQPGGTPIYFAIDQDPEDHRQIILDYFQGIQEGCAQYLADMQAQGTPATVYDIGVYGSGCVLDWCKDQGIATWFWQSFAPGWCGNSAVWPGANIHTWTVQDAREDGKHLPCGSETFDRLEGWGNEGGWTVTAAAQGQALSVRLPAAPPKRKYARGQAVDSSPRLIANSPVNAVTGGEGNVTWELDQFPGVKMASQSAVAPLQSAETIELSNWPYCDHANGTRASAWFTVDWKFSGQSLGHVRITPSGSQQGSEPLRVEARIEDGTNRDATTTSLTVRFTYHFSTAGGADVVALTELKLYSDGSIDQNSNWTSRVAA